MRCLLTLAYDGTNYGGFQIQENADTIARRLNAALSKVYGAAVTARGASRTDAGVHAIGQRALFCVPDELFRIPTAKLQLVINSFLPRDIAVIKAEPLPDGDFADFHVVTSAKRKTYVYQIDNNKTRNPLTRLFAAHEPRPLDIEAMREAAAAFVGEKDFAACMAAGGKVKTTIRKILALDITGAGAPCFNNLGNIVQITATGNGFLYNMVRIIAGTLIEVGTGRIAKESVTERIASLSRANMGKTAPACGLTLFSIEY